MRFLPVLVLVALSGCAEPPDRRNAPRYDDVRISPQSMRTGVDSRAAIAGVVGARVSVGVIDHAGLETIDLPRWDGALRLVRWPSAELVPGVWRLDSEGAIHTFAFEPEASTYEEGWYAIQIDFSVIGEDREARLPYQFPVIDGWTTNLL